MNNFRITIPFRTKCGWPARLLGVLKDGDYPYVVAVQNPGIGREEVVLYDKSGSLPVKDAGGLDMGCVDGALSLVNISDDEYFAVAPATHVTAAVEELPSWPPNCNSMRHDHFSMGTPLVRGWIALHEGYGRPGDIDPLRNVTLVNEKSGQRFVVRFAPVATPKGETK